MKPNRVGYISLLFIKIIDIKIGFLYKIKRWLSKNIEASNIEIRKNNNSDIYITYKDTDKNINISLKEFLESGLFVKLSDVEKDEFIIFLSREINIKKNYKFNIKENNKIDVSLDGEIVLDNIDKYELLKNRSIIESADDNAYEDILNIRDNKVIKIIDEV